MTTGARIVVVGGGFAGLESAFLLRSKLGERADITLVSDRDQFLFKPNTIYIPFGGTEESLLIPLEKATASAELAEIIDRGNAQLGIQIDPAQKARIARLSEGLPYYTHLLSLHAAQRALMDGRDRIEAADVDAGIAKGVQKAQASIRSAWQRATRSPRPESRFEEVLLACALAEIDELGYFTARAVRSPLSRILGKNVEIPAFANHLNAFTTEARAHVLQKRGEQRRYFYRFENPSLRPFVILSGLTKGLITEQDIAELQTYAGDGDEVSDAPNGLEPLF